MDINNKKNRSDLKSYFVKNSIPTQSNFEELIDGMLNQKDDGIVKSPDALCIEATGDLAGLQRVINFYAKFQDANPAWSLQLNPRTDLNDPATAKAGFGVVDSAGWARLFIDQKTGNVGIGTTAPIAKLDIHHSGLARVDTHPKEVKGLYITGDFGEDKDGIEFRHRNGSQGIGFGFNTIYAAGSNLNQDLQLKPKGNGVMRVLGNVEIGASSVKLGLDSTPVLLRVKGVASISNGKDYAAITNYMSSGSLTIGGTDVSFGGGTGWNTNTAGLLLETSANTEIAVHHSLNRLASMMYYDGTKKNITIGRDMGNSYGETPVTIAGDATLKGKLTVTDDVAIEASNVKLGLDATNVMLRVIGVTNISNGKDYAVVEKRMSSGSLTIGSTNTSYGEGTGWSSNTAGLLLETKENTEIAVHHFGSRLASLMYYEGSKKSITIGRERDNGVTPVTIAGDLTINGRIISEQWIDATLENRWVRYSDEYNPPQYFKDNAGIVWLRGLVKNGSSTIFTLPEGYRPANRQLHVVSICSSDKSTSVFGRVDVTTDGKIEPVVGHSAWTCLDSISFRAAQ